MSHLPRESEVTHLILINPSGITFIPSHFRFRPPFRQNAQALKDAQAPKNENSSEESCWRSKESLPLLLALSPCWSRVGSSVILYSIKCKVSTWTGSSSLWISSQQPKDLACQLYLRKGVWEASLITHLVKCHYSAPLYWPQAKSPAKDLAGKDQLMSLP